MEERNKQKVFIETYGCQMNFSDSEIVGSILSNNEYTLTTDINEADYILINTCAIRDNAEQRIRKRLKELKALQRKRSWLKIGVLGCMAERLKEALLEGGTGVDLVEVLHVMGTVPLMSQIMEALCLCQRSTCFQKRLMPQMHPVKKPEGVYELFFHKIAPFSRSCLSLWERCPVRTLGGEGSSC